MTAQRVSEVAGARQIEIDLRAREWKLPADRVKNGSAHCVPLSPLAIRLFEEAMSRSKSACFVFPSPFTDQAIIGQAVAKAMKRSSAHLQLDNATPHDLRRTAATGMAKRRIPRLTIDKVLNHISADRSTIAGVYDRHAYDVEKREALQCWADALGEIVRNETANIVALRLPERFAAAQ